MGSKNRFGFLPESVLPCPAPVTGHHRRFFGQEVRNQPGLRKFVVSLSLSGLQMTKTSGTTTVRSSRSSRTSVGAIKGLQFPPCVST